VVYREPRAQVYQKGGSSRWDAGERVLKDFNFPSILPFDGINFSRLGLRSFLLVRSEPSNESLLDACCSRP